MLEQYEAEKKNERRAVNNILRASAIEKDSKKWLYMLGTDIPRKEIISIKFENTLERKSGRYWDISAKRDESVICVVEDVKDVLAMERTHEFNRSISCTSWLNFTDEWNWSRKYKNKRIAFKTYGRNS